MICDNCVMLETFGEKGVDEFWNKCALLDISNLEEGDACEYFEEIPQCPQCGKNLVHPDQCYDDFCGWETITEEKEEGCIII